MLSQKTTKSRHPGPLFSSVFQPLIVETEKIDLFSFFDNVLHQMQFHNSI